MKMQQHIPGPPRFWSGRAARTRNGAVVALCLLAAGFSSESLAQAPAGPLPPLLAGESGASVEYPAPTLRHTDLRRAIAADSERSPEPSSKRKLSAEERDALHRDLRAAMRGAYPESETRHRDPR
ncbi:hypothetical protein GRF61_04355 [Azoarcus sp. TTM-91]|uniref:hypothetical protein n=1 Tax=Azoarcus sp. TTM-91 TaxID=2691581 RepID=UPI00145E7066|nr:hypothetical protein [Azoarcus sp. TTM-91]NMG33679.1 hypothetical protein [Azoarcus sp. TTM-91]